MKRTCVLLALTALLIALSLLSGCARKPAANLTPTDALDAWAQSLDSRDRRKLERTGFLEFSYAGLKKSDPTHAEVVKAFFNQSRGSVAKDPTWANDSPETITFSQNGTGQYQIIVSTTRGSRISHTLPSAPGTKPEDNK